MYIDMEDIEEFLKLLELAAGIVTFEGTGTNTPKEMDVKPFVFITRLTESFKDGSIKSSILVSAIDPLSENRDIIRYIESIGTTKIAPEYFKTDPDFKGIYDKYKAENDKLDTSIQSRIAEFIKGFNSKGYEVFKGVLTV